MGDLTLFLPETTILLGALLALTATCVRVPYAVVWTSSVLMAAAGVVVTALMLNAEGQPFFEGIYTVDAFSQSLKLGVVAGLLLTLLASGRPGSIRAWTRPDVPFFLFLSALGMMMLMSATELLTLFVALELSAYGLYVLAALHRSQREGSEAAVKYILFGAAASGVTIYGVSLLFGTTQTTYLDEVTRQLDSPLGLVGALLAISGVLFKLAVFPFHAWAPDTYQGAPHEAATFIGTASKVAAVGALARLLAIVGPEEPTVTNVLLVLCVASMFIGNLAAIVQQDFKRLLAYSTIAHAGYLMIGLACLTEAGVAAAIFYALIYVPMAFCAFLVVCVVGADGSNPSKASLAGLHARNPLIAASLMVGMFALAGIPPTCGFAGKWFLFSAAIDAGFFWLVLVGAINATVSLYYYLRVIREAYLAPPAAETPIEAGPAASLAAWVGVALVVVAGFYPTPIWEMAERAAAALVGG
jgi:NADH-quinone oxidoreductase subunit N